MRIVFTFLFLFLTWGAMAQRYWIGTVPGVWNTTLNWSATSGGPGGASVPGPGDQVIFNGAGGSNGNCNLDIAPTVAGITINGYTGTIDLLGFNLTTTGTNIFTTGTVANTGVAASVVLNTTVNTTFNGTLLNANVTGTTGRIFFNGSTFNNPVSITKTTNINDNSTGGNTFSGSVVLTNLSTGQFQMAGTNPDIFNGILTINQNNTGQIMMARVAAGTQFNGSIIINYNDTGVISFGANGGTSSLATGRTISVASFGAGGCGNLSLSAFAQVGATAQSINLTGNNSAQLTIQSGTTFNGNTTLTAARFNLAGGIFNGSLVAQKTGDTDDNCTGGNTYNGTVNIINSSANDFNLANTNPDTFNNNVQLNNLGSRRIQIGINSAGNFFGGDLTINHGGSSPGGVNTIIARNAGASATINGNLILNCTNADAASGIIIANDGTVNINGNIAVSATNGRGVYFGNASGNVTLGNGFTISNGLFNTGTLSLSTFTQTGATAQNLNLTGTATLTISNNSQFNGNVNFVAPRLFLNGSTYNGVTYLEKNGANNDDGTGGNTFSLPATIVNSGTGYLRTASSSPDVFNNDVTVTNSGSSLIYLAHNVAGNQFNGNITVSATSGTGIYFSNNASGSSTQAATKIISTSGFSSGELRISRFTQLGTGNTNLNLSGATTVLRVGPNSIFGGDVDFRSPQLYLDGITVNGTSYLEKTGATNDASAGGNIFTGAARVINSGTGYLLLGNGTRDQFLGTAVFDNIGEYRIYFAHNHPGQTTTFGSDLTLNSNKSGGADQWAYLIAENGTSGISIAGNLNINCAGVIRSDYRFLNGAGSAAVINGLTTITILNSHPSTTLIMGENGTTTYNGNISVTNNNGSNGVTFNNGAASSSTVNGTISTGGFSSGSLNLFRFSQVGIIPTNLTLTNNGTILRVGPNSSFDGDTFFIAPRLFLNGAVYNGTTHLEKNGTTEDTGLGDNTFLGQTVIANSGSGNLRTNGNNTFNNTTTIFNSGSAYILLELTSGSTYNGAVTFNNTSSVSIRVAYQGATVFNNNIIVNNTAGTGILFCESAGATATLNDPGSIIIGGSGFNTGELRLRGFNHLGFNQQTLTLTGASLLTLGPASIFNGDVTFTSPRLLLNGTTYNGAAQLEKTSVTNDDGNGGNVFNSIAVIINSGNSYLRTAVSSPDIFQNTLAIVNSGSSTIRMADNSAGNQFNGNVELNSTFGGGIYFCNSANGTAQLAATRTIGVGGFGVISGDVRLIRFTQIGATNQTLNLTGIATLTLGPSSSFGGNVNFSASRLLLNGATYTGTAQLEKKGALNDTGTGGNIFASDATIINSGSGQLITANASPDTFNANVTVTNTGSNIIFLAHNVPGTIFNGNITLNSTFISGSGGVYFGNTTTGGATLNAGGSLLVGGSGFSSGQLRLRRFTQLGGTAQTLTLTGTSLLELGPSSVFNGNVDFRSPEFQLDGAIFNGITRLEKNGAVNNDSQGNNIFNGVTTIVNSGTGYFRFAVSALDQFNNDLILENTGTSTIRMADVIAGSLFNGNIQVNSTNGGGIFFGDNPPANATLAAGRTITVGPSGFSLGELRLDRFIQLGATPQNLTLTGTAILTIGPGSQYNGNVNFSAPQLYLSGGTFNGTAALTKTGATGNTGAGNNIFAQSTMITNSGSGVLRTDGTNAFNTVGGTTTIVNSGSSDVLLELNSGSTYNGNVTFTNTGSSYIRVGYRGANTFNGNIVVNSTNGTGVWFSEIAGGTSVLAASRTITVGGTGFSAGELNLQRFTQTGSTAQALTLTGNAIFRSGTATLWGGNLTVSSPRVFLDGSTFNGTTSITKTNANTDASFGGNTFNATTSLINTGAGILRLANNASDNFISDITFNQIGGTIQPAYNQPSNFQGNVTVNGASPITFGANNGTAVFTGSNPQTIDRSGAAAPVFRRLQMNKPSNTVTLNTTISITTSATFTSGILNTDAINMLSFADNATSSGGSNASHIDGPVTKVGNDAFVFPTGDNGIFRTITISAPSNTSHTFTAEYFHTSQAFGNAATYDPSFYSVSSCEFWTLDRTPAIGGSNVSVTLSWNSADCSGPYIGDLSTLRVTRWNGSSWVNHGNGGTTGNAATGTVVSSGVVTSFSPFTLASTSSANPLPIELIEFVATPLGNIVELSWITLSELNNDYFTVERSISGFEFEEVGIVKGAGTVNERKYYRYLDQQPKVGVSYYRLKQTDFDGTVSFSEIARVDLNAPAQIVVHPNPIARSTTAALNYSGSFAVFNSMGQMVLLIENSNELDIRGLPSGVYTIKSANGSFSRFVIE